MQVSEDAYKVLGSGKTIKWIAAHRAKSLAQEVVRLTKIIDEAEDMLWEYFSTGPCHKTNEERFWKWLKKYGKE